MTISPKQNFDLAKSAEKCERTPLNTQNCHIDFTKIITFPNLQKQSVREIKLSIIVNNNPVQRLYFVAFGDTFKQAFCLKNNVRINADAICILLESDEEFLRSIPTQFNNGNINIAFLKTLIHGALQENQITIIPNQDSININSTLGWEKGDTNRNRARDIVMALSLKNKELIKVLKRHLQTILKPDKDLTLVKLLNLFKEQYPQSDDRRSIIEKIPINSLHLSEKTKLIADLEALGYLYPENHAEVVVDFGTIGDIKLSDM